MYVERQGRCSYIYNGQIILVNCSSLKHISTVNMLIRIDAIYNNNTIYDNENDQTCH